MTKQTFQLLEEYMLSCMKDSAHDKDHIYRVLSYALQIADTEASVDYDVLITACLLHDIGRTDQFRNPALCHAIAGGEKAYQFLIESGFSEAFSVKVRRCIQQHRYRKSNPPDSPEAIILFDADKLDVTGAMGIARSLVYKGIVEEPLYTRKEDGTVSDGANDISPSFLHEYKFKLEKLYSRFYTKKGTEMAKERQAAAVLFYNSLLCEANSAHANGDILLEKILTNDSSEFAQRS